MTGEKLKAIIAERIERDPRLRKIRAKTAKGKATKADSFTYSRICSEIMSEELSRAVLDLDDREGICAALLRGNYGEIMQAADAIHRSIDEKQGIHMQPRRPAFPAERVQQIAHSLVQPDVPDEKIVRRAGSTATVSMSFHDDFVQENAAFRARAGLKCYITRETDGSCCKWCSALAGRYEYGEEPQDVYHRHDNCGCTVTYENGRKRQDVWSKREWEAPEAGAGAKEPTRLSFAQAAAKEAEHLPRVLTGGQKPDIINQKISDRMYNSNVYTEDEKELAEIGVIPFHEIEDALMASPIGRHVAQYIESQNMVIELDYTLDSNGLSGEINDPFITVYVADMRTIEEVVETIVHETAHKQFDWQYTQEDEINCRIYEYLSTHDEISEQKIHEIVDFVQEHYSDFPEGNLYGY